MGEAEVRATGEGEGAPVVRRCRAEDVRSIELREPPARRYAATPRARQEAGLCAYLVAWLHGEPVGSGELEWGSPPELKNLHVEASHRGRGIGAALVREAESEAAAAGCDRIRIRVAEDNPAASRLYTRLGYAPTGESVTYSYTYVDDDGQARDAVETSRSLEKSLRPHE